MNFFKKKPRIYLLYATVTGIITLHSVSIAAEKPKLADFKVNVYSQFGEDGIIEKFLRLSAKKVAIVSNLERGMASFFQTQLIFGLTRDGVPS